MSDQDNKSEAPTNMDLPRFQEEPSLSGQIQTVDAQPVLDPDATKPTPGLAEDTKENPAVSAVNSGITVPSEKTLSELGTPPNPLSPTKVEVPTDEDTPEMGSTPAPDLSKVDPATTEGRQDIQRAARKLNFVESFMNRVRGNRN